MSERVTISEDDDVKTAEKKECIEDVPESEEVAINIANMTKVYGASYIKKLLQCNYV